MIYDQAEFDIRCEWGLNGVMTLAPISDAVIIVDVMSFSTAVVDATARGARVYPYRGDSAIEFAASLGAELAGHRGEAPYSLSPASLASIPSGTCLVLPSPNGSTLSLSTGVTPTFAGCLRTARAVAAAGRRCGDTIAVIPGGERWRSDGSLRVAFEDLVGAGALIQYLKGSRSPEAQAAVGAYSRARGDILAALSQCSSGKELISEGHERDISYSAHVDVDDCAPRLQDGAYVHLEL